VAGLAGPRQNRQEIVMNATSPQRSTVPTLVARKAAFCSRRAVGFVIAATVSLLSLGLSAPAFAMIVPPGGGTADPANALTTSPAAVTSSGVATWQVALIAAGAALIGAVVVLLAARLRPARRAAAASAA
jgi:hypothetical protein